MHSPSLDADPSIVSADAHTDPPLSQEPDEQLRGRSGDQQSWFARRGLDTVDLLTLAAVFFLCIGFAPFSLVFGWTPRMAVLIATLPISAFALARQVRRRDRIAILTAILAGWTVLAALLSDAPRYALFGTFGADQSGLIIIGSVAMLALGRNLSREGRAVLGPIFVSGIALSCLVGLAQFVLGVDSGPFAIGAGRVFGLASNPVYFGSLAAGALAVVACRVVMAKGWVVPGLLVAFFGVLVVLSGSRIALVAAGVSALWPLIHWRTRREAAVVFSAVVGVALGNLLASSSGSGTVGRVTEAGSGGRTEMWRTSIAPILERPILGWGPGQFHTAVQSHISATFQMTEGAGLLNSWRDPHNVVLGAAISLGLVGLVIVAILTVAIARHARGALAVGGSVIAIAWLLQPAPVMTMPLALVLVGAALPSVSELRGSSRSGTGADETTNDGELRTFAIWQTGVVLLAVGLALYLFVADARIRSAAESFDAVAVEEAITWLPPDPILTDVATVVWMTDSSVTATDAVQRSAQSAARSAELQPGLAAWWTKLAIRQFLAGDSDLARVSAERALTMEPNSFTALSVLQEVARVDDDAELRAQIQAKSCAVGLVDCVD